MHFAHHTPHHHHIQRCQLLILQKSLAEWAKGVGFQGSYNIQKGEDTPFGWWLADKYCSLAPSLICRVVFSTVKKALGLDRCHFQVCTEKFLPSCVESCGAHVCMSRLRTSPPLQSRALPVAATDLVAGHSRGPHRTGHAGVFPQAQHPHLRGLRHERVLRSTGGPCTDPLHSSLLRCTFVCAPCLFPLPVYLPMVCPACRLCSACNHFALLINGAVCVATWTAPHRLMWPCT